MGTGVQKARSLLNEPAIIQIVQVLSDGAATHSECSTPSEHASPLCIHLFKFRPAFPSGRSESDVPTPARAAESWSLV